MTPRPCPRSYELRLGSPGLSSPSPRQDGAPLTVSLLLFRLGGRHPRRRPGLCGGEEPGGVPRLRHPLLPHLPGERRASARRSHGRGLGAGVSQLRGFCVQGSPLVAPRWIAGSHWDCARACSHPARPAGAGAASAALRARAQVRRGPQGPCPGVGVWCLPAVPVAVAALQTSLPHLSR